LTPSISRVPGAERGDLLRRGTKALAAGLGQSIFDGEILCLNPSKRLQSGLEGGDPGGRLGLLGENNPDPPHPTGLLPDNGERPDNSRTGDERDKFAPAHA
jgi:hypothetical protein